MESRTCDAADRLKADLEALVRCGPGAAPDLLRTVRELLRGLLVHRHSGLRRRAVDVMWLFEDWFSPTRYNQTGDGGKRTRELLVSAIARLHSNMSDYCDPG